MRSTNDFIKLNDNNFFERPSVIASSVNEVNEVSGGPTTKSLECRLQLITANPNISPIIDTGTIGALGIMNRINDIDVSGDVSTGRAYTPSTEPDGDNNEFVYITRKVALKNPASSIKVIADNFRPPDTDLKFMFKILKNDETTPIDDLGFEFFNTDGSPDNTVPNSLVKTDFQEYVFTAGVNDDGVGEPLDDFIQFQIKIVMQGTDASKPVRIKDLRAIALAT